MGDFRSPQTPGIGGLDELTDSEELTIQQIQSLEDPGADRILFWDDSTSNWNLLEAGSGIDITDTTISATAAGGDVSGPASSTDNAIARFDGTGGKTIQNSGVTIDDSNNIDVNNSNISNVANLTFQTGATGGTIRTGTSASDKFEVQAYDTNASAYREMFTLTSNNPPTIVFNTNNADSDFVINDSSATAFQITGSNGDIQFGGSTGLFWNNTNDALSIGNSQNQFTLNGTTYGSNIASHVEGATNLLGIVAARHSDSAISGGHFVGIRSRGTEASNSIVGDGDKLMRLVGLGYDGTDYEFAGEINIEVDGTPGDGDMPGRIVFYTTPDGSTTEQERLRISNDGTLSMDGGTTNIASTEFNILDGMTGKTGSDTSFVTGTAGTSGNISQWNADGDLVDASIAASDVVTPSSTDTFTNKTFDANATGNSLSNVEVADFASGAVSGGGSTLETEFSKSITIESPTDSEDISMFFTNKAITITEIRAVLRGSSTPSVTWTIRHASDRSAAGNEVVTSGTTTTSTTTGSDVTSFNDADIPADSFVWIETTAQSGTVDELNITVMFTID